MAERRMMTKKVIHSDAFLDMPTSTQNLYFHLLLEGDDEGFVNSPKKIQRIIGASDDDAKILLAKNFIISFDSGVIVIKHWKMHNYIQNDRFKPTSHTDERALLSIKDNNVYTMDTDCIQSGRLGKGSIGEVRLGESRLGKSNIDGQEKKYDKFKTEIQEIVSHLNLVTKSNYKSTGKKTKSLILARLNDGFSVDDFFHVHLVKTAEWINDSKMKAFLRPETLYSNKFEGYLNQHISDYDKARLIQMQTGKSMTEIMQGGLQCMS